ncbi:MAG: 3-methylcrotonyl-CoA carboxylase [Gammaproteobacteria bacterium]|nr:MAG: 3-methylcrotonyl-CoA carboxylase [Gammaproteobacteria bacterium]
MFNKILIANRGEIAIRIARTARRLGIVSVAVYSSADRDALHVEACDEAWCIGGAAASDSYLRGNKILEVAQQCGARAIHPGYGFLSENATFARSCEQAGIVFIGPPASAIEAMGSKSEAKALMAAAGVPLVPGYHGDAQDNQTLLSQSNQLGYPQLIKASAGGGGKGMRVVSQASEFEVALESVRREARASFDDDRVLIERYLSNPRHVEMQIFADRAGNCIHLFERDCSIQRRHQKILEEAPAPGIDAALRNSMGEAAVNCAMAINYVGAGTVEFLLDEYGSFYFMEMNTRLQVEHPVTEMITGLDLVEWQLQVAAGGPLPMSQDALVISGHALEARIYAESPERDFMPATGRVEYLSAPNTSASVRVDTGVRAGDDIGINYDPLIAKLIVHGHDRKQAIARMQQALLDYQVLGLQTNIAFLSRLVSTDSFRLAEFDTGFIEQHRYELFAEDASLRERAVLIAATALIPGLPGNPRTQVVEFEAQSPWALKNSWRMNASAAHSIRISDGNSSYELSATRLDRGWALVYENNRHLVEAGWLDSKRLQLELDGERIIVPVIIGQDSIALCLQGREWKFELHVAGQGEDDTAATQGKLVAPMPGSIIALQVAVGDTVQPGDLLMVLEAMKMEHSIVASAEATVSEIFFAIGDQVEEGQQLLSLE